METEKCRCTIAGQVEVVTQRTIDGGFETQIHGGRLDGERFTCDADADPGAQHERGCLLARKATWPRRWRKVR